MQDNQMDLTHSRIYLPLDTIPRNLFSCTMLLFDKTPQTQPPNYFRQTFQKKTRYCALPLNIHSLTLKQ